MVKEQVTHTLQTTAQVASLLGLTPRRVRQLAESGRLACMKTPLGRFFDPFDVETLRRSREAA